ncbi:MAG: TfoX/Sxy family protein [Actinomycetia bacterium]|nr:TfoX/Sxy family protein [Actinomycetes bacterium]
MGEAGARATGASQQPAEHLTVVFTPLGDVTTKKMFGGHGIFVDSIMFALVDSAGTAFLRSDPASAEEFEQRGGRKHARMPYWQVPEDVLDDEDELLRWGTRAADAARSAKK